MDTDEVLYKSECWDNQNYGMVVSELVNTIKRSPAEPFLTRLVEHFCSFRPVGHPFVVPNMEDVIFEAIKQFSQITLAKAPESEDDSPQNWQIRIEFSGQDDSLLLQGEYRCTYRESESFQDTKSITNLLSARIDFGASAYTVVVKDHVSKGSVKGLTGTEFSFKHTKKSDNVYR